MEAVASISLSFTRMYTRFSAIVAHARLRFEKIAANAYTGSAIRLRACTCAARICTASARRYESAHCNMLTAQGLATLRARVGGGSPWSNRLSLERVAEVKTLL